MHTGSTDFIRNAIMQDSLCDAKGTYESMACVEGNIADLIVMIRYPPCSKHTIVLRTMIFGAGMLAVLLLAGTGWRRARDVGGR